MIKLSSIKPNKDNPRVIGKQEFEDLKKSITDFPQMMRLRPIVVDANNQILGGNMRFKALKTLGYKEIEDDWIVRADDLTDDQKKRFLITDNVQFGAWDYEELANTWDVNDIKDWVGSAIKSVNEDWGNEFKPNLEPETDKSDISAEDVEKMAKKLAMQMIKDRPAVDCICPQCGAEFQIENTNG